MIGRQTSQDGTQRNEMPLANRMCPQYSLGKKKTQSQCLHQIGVKCVFINHGQVVPVI